jgi:hypothetical protein
MHVRLDGVFQQAVTILSRLVEDTELRRRISHQVHQHVRTRRTYAKAEANRLAFYTKLVNSRGSYRCADDIAPATGYKEIVADIEPALVQAMLMHRDSRINEAIQIYARLLQLAPDFYLLWERMGQACVAIGAKDQANTSESLIS